MSSSRGLAAATAAGRAPCCPQVTQYGEGGHYNWHSDGTPSPCGLFEWTGCRAFTAIVYLSELPAEGGGATAIQFDDGRVARVLPKLGSAVFFHS